MNPKQGGENGGTRRRLIDTHQHIRVIGGPGAFLISVMGFESFGYAMANKLLRETV